RLVAASRASIQRSAGSCPLEPARYQPAGRAIKHLVGYAPDRAVGVLRYEQRAIVGDRNSNWPSPDLGVVGDKSGEKVLVFSRWRPIFEANSDDFVAGTLGSIPGSVFRGETVAVI